MTLLNIMFRTLVFCGIVASCLAVHKFSFEDCTTSANPLLSVSNINLAVDPIHFPGNETGSVDIAVLQDITGMHHELRVQVQKKVFMGYVDVPCISNVGSCTYQVCQLLDGHMFPNNTHNCPSEIAATSPDFQCACPVQKGTYHLNPTTVFIAEPSGLYKFAAQGEYRAKLAIVDTNTNEEVGCYIFYVATESNCVGVSCLFGK